MADLTLDRVGRELLFASFFGNAPRATTAFMLERLGATIEAVQLSAGSVLWREGDDTDHVFFMPDGRIRAHAEGHPDWVYEGRWALGATDVTLHRRRARTMTAERDTVIFRLPSGLYFDLLEDNSDICQNAIIGNARGLLRLWNELAADPHLAPPVPEPRAGHDEQTLVGRAVLLGGMDILKGASAQALSDLARETEVVDLAAGTVLASPDQPARRVHLVLRGAVEARRLGPAITVRFAPGATVAAPVFLTAEPAFTVQALTPTRLLSFGLDDWLDQMEEHPEMAASALGALALERERLQDLIGARTGELVMG